MVAIRSLTKALRSIVTGKWNLGVCPVCERRTVFLKTDPWLRDFYICVYCRSVPRQRAIIHIIETYFPKYREMVIHESSPGGPASKKLQRECKCYLPTHFYRDTPPGEYKEGVRCENLEQLTFDENVFDLVITQDVFEHVMNPAKAFSEVARTLKPEGAHVFTVPYYPDTSTVVRSMESPGGVVHMEEEVYHGNPIDQKGSLVVTDWGNDLFDFIYANSGMTTSICSLFDPRRGLEASFLDVFISRKGEITSSKRNC